MPATLRLQNEFYRIDIDTRNGGIRQLTDRRAAAGAGDLIAEPRLAEGFRVLLPLPDVRCNYILGNEQARPRVTRDSEAIELHWPGPLKSPYGSFKLAVTLRIALVGESVEFRCSVKNSTRYAIAEVWYGFIAGMLGLGPRKHWLETEALVNTGSVWRKPIFRDFGNTRGQTLGVTSVEHGWSYPGYTTMPWMSLFNPRVNRAVFFAALEETPRVKMIRLAMEPGAAEHRVGGNWLREGEIKGEPRGLVMNWAHFPYTKPGETFTGSPIVLRCHEGDWRRGAEIYREWFASRFPVAESKANYMRRDPAFVHTMFMLPEDNVNLRFTDIPRWAKAAKDRGVNHVMIAGWQIGGHDRGYPYYTPDPKLGTWKELERGIRGAHDLGVKVSFFINCQPIDASMPWYEKELKNYLFLDPYGMPPHIINYWGMGTLSARSRFTATPFVEMNPHHPRVRKLLIDQFVRLVEIGADGLHIDKFFNHAMDFNPRLKGTSPDLAHHQGILKFAAEFEAACKAINPDFAWSFEGGWDRLMSFTDAMWWGPMESSMKAVFPEMGRTTGVEQPGDFNKANLAILNGDAFLIGPAKYNPGLDWKPMQPLARYLKEINRIRREHWEVLCAGEIVDASSGLFARKTPSVKVGGPFAKSPHTAWRVMRNRQSGRRAILLANLGGENLRATGIGPAAGVLRSARLCRAFEKDREAKLPVTVDVQAESVAFLVEA